MEKIIAVIGGGGTGLATAYDLAQRGFGVTLFDRGEFTGGTTGRHHGQLHSGARYVSQDSGIAAECYEESVILRRIAPEAIEYNEGIFLAISDEDEAYTQLFLSASEDAGIPVRLMTAGEVLEREPLINPGVKHGVLVPDGTIDAYRLAMHFAAGAQSCGAWLRNFTEVTSIEMSDDLRWIVRAMDHRTGTEETHTFDAVVNAGGAWAGQIAEKAGLDLHVSPSPGTMLAVRGRHTNMVISRLSPPGDGDILVPQRRLTIIGSTQWLAEDPNDLRIPDGDIDFLQSRADEMLPGFSELEVHATWCAPRPLVGDAGGSPEIRGLSRDFRVFHHSKEGAQGFFSIIGGKATVLRGMAQAVSDEVCEYLGENTPCRTADVPLPSYRTFTPGGRA